MNCRVIPVSRLKGTFYPPASKSYSIRAFIIAALGGSSKIINPSESTDCIVARQACGCFGAEIIRKKKGVYSVRGRIPVDAKQRSINVSESGTTLRFLISLTALFPGATSIRGTGTLKNRPNRPLVSVLQSMGFDIAGTGPLATVPIRVRGGGSLGGMVEIDGTLSSQFISSLLIAAPRFSGDTHVRITGDYVVSQPYIDMTLVLLKKAGISVQKIGNRDYFILGNQAYKGLGEFSVPADYGLSAFCMAAASLVKSDVLFSGLHTHDAVQADRKIIEFLKRMGARFAETSAGLRFRGPFRLRGGTFVLRDSPDLVPIMGVLGLFCDGVTRLCGIEHVRVKESNRITALRQELLKLGARVEEKKDELIIERSSELKKNIVLNPHNDHRLAMAFCILGMKVGVIVKDIECVAKSYPHFLNDLRLVGGRFRKQ